MEGQSSGGGYVLPPEYIVDQRGAGGLHYPAAPARDYNNHQQQQVVYAPVGYVGRPPISPQRKRKNRVANAVAAIFVACWCITWPCHGPCCCGL